MAGWVPVPVSDWADQRTSISGRWPPVLVVLDLRYWDDPIACGGRKRPSLRALATAWGWGKSSVAEIIKNRDQWADTGRTVTGQSPDTGRTDDQPKRRAVGPKPDTGRTVTGQSPDTGRTPLKETRARSPNTQHPTPSPPSPSEKNTCPDFDRLAGYWAEQAALHRGDKRTRAPKQSSKGEPSKALRRLIKECDSPEDIEVLIRWHWHGDPFNRDNGNGLSTLARHHERYIVTALDWAAGKTPAKPRRPGKQSNMRDLEDLIFSSPPPDDADIIDTTFCREPPWP